MLQCKALFFFTLQLRVRHHIVDSGGIWWWCSLSCNLHSMYICAPRSSILCFVEKIKRKTENRTHYIRIYLDANINSFSHIWPGFQFLSCVLLQPFYKHWTFTPLMYNHFSPTQVVIVRFFRFRFHLGSQSFTCSFFHIRQMWAEVKNRKTMCDSKREKNCHSLVFRRNVKTHSDVFVAKCRECICTSLHIDVYWNVSKHECVGVCSCVRE